MRIRDALGCVPKGNLSPTLNLCARESNATKPLRHLVLRHTDKPTPSSYSPLIPSIQAALTKHYRLGMEWRGRWTHQQQAFISHASAAWKSRIKVQQVQCLMRVPSGCVPMSGGGVRVLPFMRTLIPLLRAPPQDLVTS